MKRNQKASYSLAVFRRNLYTMSRLCRELEQNEQFEVLFFELSFAVTQKEWKLPIADVILMEAMASEESTINFIDYLASLPFPRPIILMLPAGSTATESSKKLFVKHGAVEIFHLPAIYSENKAPFQKLMDSIKVVSGAKVVSRWRDSSSISGEDLPVPFGLNSTQLVAFGSSTGGPQVLLDILSELPAPLPFPVIVCQHILSGYIDTFAAWLENSGHPVRVVAESQDLEKGVVYLAPAEENVHMVRWNHVELRLPFANEITPNVDALFLSIATIMARQTCAILLSGMGDDGVEGLLKLKERGATTIAQNEKTSLVFGMPGAAVKKDACTKVLSPRGIATYLNKVIRSSSN
jgi:two-component system chemotaxis response regulator CheB